MAPATAPDDPEAGLAGVPASARTSGGGRAGPTALGAARIERAGLHDALVALEAAVAAPVPGRVADWGRAVHEALVTVTAVFERHLAVTEGADGLFADIVQTSPRCARAVAAIRAHHRTLGTELAEATAHARTLDPVQDAAAGLREHVMRLLAAFIRHRQMGSDLVYDAYATDIGGSE